MTTYTPDQLAALRKQYDIPENFFPVAVAPSVIVWGTKSEGE